MGDCICGPRHVAGRACTPEAKRAVIEQLVAAWERYPRQRLGQLVVNAAEGGDPFCTEDEPMLSALKAMAEREKPQAG
jgi:hypothetical protein